MTENIKLLNKRKTIVFIRSGPISITPAVERYVRVLRSNKFNGWALGLEYNFTERKFEKLNGLDELISFKRHYCNNFYRTIDHFLWQGVQLNTLIRKKIDIVQFCDVFCACPAVLLKPFMGYKLIFDIRDNIKPSFTHKTIFFARFLGLVESIAALCSDQIILVRESRLKFLPKFARNKVTIIGNVPLDDKFKGHTLNTDGKLKVNLSGFISTARNLETWLRLNRQNERIVLQIYGNVLGGKEKSLLKEFGFINVPSYSSEVSLKKTISADVVSLMYDPSMEINKYAEPNKYYEALMLGKPVICAKGMEIGKEVEMEQCGIAVSYGNIEEMSKAVEYLMQPGILKNMGNHSRALFEKKYKNSTWKKIHNLYKKMAFMI